VDLSETGIAAGVASAQPQVSVIIPFRNAEAWVAQCCASVRQQTLADWEALLINDGSTDHSVELAEAEARRDRRFLVLQTLRTPDQAPGPWLPRNLGIEQARGRWIAFLDADDLWHPLKLERQLQLLQQQGGDLCVSAYVRFDEASGLIRACRMPPARLSNTNLKAVNPLPMSSVVVRRSLLRAMPFRPVCHEDHDLWQRLFEEQRVSYLRVQQPLMAYRMHGRNLTQGARNRVGMKWQQWRESQRPICRTALVVAWQQLGYWVRAQRWRWKPTTLAAAGFPIASAKQQPAG